MSNKLTTTHHDGTAPNCVNHLNVVAFGKRPDATRVCMMPECDPAGHIEKALAPKRIRRRATKKAGADNG